MKKATKTRCVTFSLAMLLSVGIAPGAIASDHLDALNTILDESADVTGLMAFTSPENPDRLVLIMDVHAIASKRAKFSKDVTYRFQLRSVKQVGEAGKIDVVLDPKPLWLACALTDDESSMSCRSNTGVSTSAALDELSGGSSPDLRLFAGLRSDPFFMDIPGYLETYALQKAVDLMPPELEAYFDDVAPGETAPRVFRFTGKNSADGGNVLSIVAEIDVAKVFGPEVGPMFAVAAATVERLEE